MHPKFKIFVGEGGREGERERERDREKERERSGTSLIFAGKLGLGGCANREHSRFVIKTTVLCDITVGCCSFSFFDRPSIPALRVDPAETQSPTP